MGNVYTEEFQAILKACKEKEITVLIDGAITTSIEHFYALCLNRAESLCHRTFFKLFLSRVADSVM